MDKTKPEWLQALEAQSWQAELIASGLAIYGSLSMGVYLDGLAEWAVLRFNDRILNILYFFFFYIYCPRCIDHQFYFSLGPTYFMGWHLRIKLRVSSRYQYG